MDWWMEQQADVRSLVEQADTLLIQGRIQEAAAAYARAVQLDPGAVGAHLGLAQAYLALGSYGTVYAACQEVQRLAPESAEAAVAQAIRQVLEHHYDTAILQLDQADRLRPGWPYVHALRAYCFRRLGNSYDAMSAESKAARLSGNRNWSHLFPPVQAPAPVVAPAPVGATAGNGTGASSGETVRSWQERSDLERRMVRMRFATRHVPIVTYTLMAINIVVYLATAAFAGNLLTPFTDYYVDAQTQIFVRTAGSNPLYDFGVEQGLLIMHQPLQAYRIVTAMFLHESIVHIGVNMLSLYFVGVITEQLFGRGRFLLIYFLGGIAGGIAQAFLVPAAPSLGASGAIFAIFGAFGAYMLANRHVLGRAANAIMGQWIFWLALNLYISFTNPNIALYDHLGGLIVGFVLGLLLTPSVMRVKR
jgi:rhomboid protease GluP